MKNNETSSQERMYNEKEVLSILEDYDREFKLNTVSYTKACTFTAKEWFNKFKNKPSREKSLNWWHSLSSIQRWLREVHNIHIIIESNLETDIVYYDWTIINMEQIGETYSTLTGIDGTYAEALEHSLLKGLKLI